MGKPEGEAWFVSALIMTIVSLTVFILQRFVSQFFNYAFEACVFYLPTILLWILYHKRKSEIGSSDSETEFMNTP